MHFKTLVVDDDEICLMIHKQIISVTGFHDSPMSFSSGEMALEYMNTLPADTGPVLLFLDINMPGMNGWEMLDIVHGEFFRTRISVVVVSSSVDGSDKDRSHAYAKVIGYIEKPFSAQALEKLKVRFPET